MKEPIKPDLGDCCVSGSCCPCVWDEYNDQLKKYTEWKSIVESDNNTK